MENYIVINGKKIELTEEQVKLITEETKEKKNPFDKVNYGEDYYTINNNGEVMKTPNLSNKYDDKRYYVANYCTDKKLMGKRALIETLNRRLWRFTYENGWTDELWKDVNVEKYCFYYSITHNKFIVNYVYGKIWDNIYFISEEVAQRAIDEIIKPFIEEHKDVLMRSEE